MEETLDLVVSIDTTGSMYPCATQVRRRVMEMIDRLFDETSGLQVGVIFHGDYCDAGTSYVTKRLELTDNRGRIHRFVASVQSTGGGDAAECYELVLHEARSFEWRSGKKTLILIGDDIPHPAGYPGNTGKLDWRNEIELLIKMGVNVYGVQALNRSHATGFYNEIASRTGGFHLTLDQFSNVVDLVMAVCYQQTDPQKLSRWEEEVECRGRMNRNLGDIFDVLSRRSTRTKRFLTPRDLEAVPFGRFQVMSVDNDQSIRDFVEENGLIFQKGRGFYELTKKETIQGYKEIILREDATGDFFSGGKARELLGLPRTGNVRTRPLVPGGFTAFIQSTSVNRKLIGGTEFLYEVDLSR